jgi:hypothetical protein
MAIVSLGADPVRLWVDPVAIVSSLVLSCTRMASSTMQLSFQLVSPIFTITPNITCSLPTRKDLGGVPIWISWWPMLWATGPSLLIDTWTKKAIHGPRKRWSRHVYTARFKWGDNKLSAASSFRGYACVCQRALQWTCIVRKFWESGFVFKWYARWWMTSLI